MKSEKTIVEEMKKEKLWQFTNYNNTDIEEYETALLKTSEAFMHEVHRRMTEECKTELEAINKKIQQLIRAKIMLNGLGIKTPYPVEVLGNTQLILTKKYHDISEKAFHIHLRDIEKEKCPDCDGSCFLEQEGTYKDAYECLLCESIHLKEK